MADLRGLGVKDGDLRPLLVGRDLEGHARARRRLAENQGDDLADKAALLTACAALSLELGCERDERVELGAREVELLKQVAAGEVHR